MTAVTVQDVERALDGTGLPSVCHVLSPEDVLPRRRLCGHRGSGMPVHSNPITDGVCDGCGRPVCVVCLELWRAS